MSEMASAPALEVMTRYALSRVALQLIATLLPAASASALADDALPVAPLRVAPFGPQIGDCVIFREGGAGWLLKAPTYWFKGSLASLSRERRLANVCLRIGKQASAYTQADQLRLAAALPCVDKESEVGEVAVLRARVAVEAWETPWSQQHGSTGWLFRGQFLEQTLSKGAVIEIDAKWLEPCGAGS